MPIADANMDQGTGGSKWAVVCLAAGLGAASLMAQEAAPRQVVAAGETQPVGAATRPVAYMVATAHLDTQWLWTIQDSIRDHIRRTMEDNLRLMEQYPDYRFSFEGAFRYELMKEYYPEQYAKVKQAVADGRWWVCGSWWDAVDTNLPSPESLVRQTLYGNGFWEKELGKTSTDVFLPDCFGFSGALPTVAAHCGLNGFSTQKLTWGSAYGIPFGIGKWRGPDGSVIFAALDPGAYGAKIEKDLSQDKGLLQRAQKLEASSGIAADYRYFGTGDTGGAPTEGSVEWLEKSIAGRGPLKVISAPADQLYGDLAKRDTSKLPVYDGELLMTTHGTGCYTSQAAMKRWNRQNERFATIAESAAAAADWLGVMPYPKETLDWAWKRFLWHQFHDDLTGTSIPAVYRFSWNDELLTQKLFTGVLEDASTAVIGQMDTEVKGTGVPVVVFNALPYARVAQVDAVIDFGHEPGGWVTAVMPDGRERLATVMQQQATRAWVRFVAEVAPGGYTVVAIRDGKPPKGTPESETQPEDALTLSNGLLRVRLDEHGQMVSLYDEVARRELLKAPVELQFLANHSAEWPAWEVLYKDMMAAPYATPGERTSIQRLAGRIEVRRELAGSTIMQTISLPTEARRVEVDTQIDWRTKATTLKAAFAMAAGNSKAQYDIGIGTIARGNNQPRLYEVPAQTWAGISDVGGEFGVAVLSDSRFGWDKPDDHTLRLTLVNTPEAPRGFREEATNDIGHHQLRYAIAPYNPRDLAGVYRQAEEFAHPVVAFQADRHGGKLGRSFSLLRVSDPGVKVMALKRAEDGSGLIVRLCNVSGREVRDCIVGLPGIIRSITEVGGTEKVIAGAGPEAQGREFLTSLKPYQIRTFCVEMPRAFEEARTIGQEPVRLAMDERLTSGSGSVAVDKVGRRIPVELWPGGVALAGVSFQPARADGANAVSCRGQMVELPSGSWDTVHILAGATEPVEATFGLDGKRPMSVHISPFVGLIGQWDSRIIDGKFVAGRMETEAAFCNPDRVAYTATHLHEANGKDALYTYGHLFAYALHDGHGVDRIALPNDPRVKILAMTVTRQGEGLAHLATPLIDRAPRVQIRGGASRFAESTTVTLVAARPGDEIHYTLDGMMPSSSSPKYEGPITVDQSCRLSAAVLGLPMGPEQVASRSFAKLQPLPAVDVRPAKAGVSYRYFEGDFGSISAIPSANPKSTGEAPGFALAPAQRKEYYALVFEGYIQASRDGEYRFGTGSDDGSALWIDDEQIVDNDQVGYREVEGIAALKAGYHKIRVAYFQGRGDATLRVWWQGPEFAKQPILSDALSH